jgi:hypothetical protein
MTAGGIIFLSCSLLFVWGLAGYCYYRVLSTPANDDDKDAQD